MPNLYRKPHRVLIKISGEFLMGAYKSGICEKALSFLANQLQSLLDEGCALALVLGGGNFFRGISAPNCLNRVKADQMGMLATVLNGLAIEDYLNHHKIKSRLYSAFEVSTFCEKFCHTKALQDMNNNIIPIFAGGLGSPFFSTDTAAVVRAIEMKCDLLIKGTQVDGVYTEDPKKNPRATLFSEISYDDVIQKHLKVMDLTAITLAKDQRLPIMVCCIHQENSFVKILKNEIPFTLIH